LLGVGVKVTEVPAQTEAAEAAILTAGVTMGLTVMATELEVAVGLVAQPIVEVITQETTSPLFKAEEV
jgi:hypothetical protein